MKSPVSTFVSYVEDCTLHRWGILGCALHVPHLSHNPACLFQKDRSDQLSPIVEKRSRTSPSEPVNSQIWQEGQTLLDTYEVKGKLGEGGWARSTACTTMLGTWTWPSNSPKLEVVAQAGVETFVNEAQAWVDLGLASAYHHLSLCAQY